MSEITPACKPSKSSLLPSKVGDSALLFLKIHPSQHLLIFYSCVHLSFLGATSYALYPLLKTQILGLLVFVLFVGLLTMNFVFLIHKKQQEYYCLVLDGNGWWLSRGRESFFSVMLKGEIVLWQSLVYLQFSECNSKGDCSGKYNLLLLNDSANEESLRCLRVWLVTKFAHEE